jgi:SAM-dependent methyltransferase
VKPYGKSIDIGCGGTLKRAAPGYTVYTDIVEPVPNFSGSYVKCPMEKMPFPDKEFDFARCHHVIEHVQDPEKACSELIRIAKAGVLSFPPMQAEIMFGRRDHRWFVTIDRGRLLFIKKRHPSYGIPRRLTGCEINVNFAWTDTFEYQVVL